MKVTLRILPLMLGILFFFTQCEKEAIDLGKTNNEDIIALKDATDNCVVVQTLWAGAGQNNLNNGTNVGEVTATLVGNTLVVEYSVEAPWYLTETHLWVGKDKLKIPKQAAPGQFPFNAILDFESGWTQVVDLASLGISPGDPIYVAAHGVVTKADGLDGIVLTEDINFRLKFFTGLTDPQAYFQTTILNAPLAGVYEGWCLDSYNRIQTNTDIFGTIYSSYDENLPILFGDKQGNLPLVNWIINYDFVGKVSPGGFGTYTLGDVQKALWILMEEIPNHDPFGGVGPFNNDRVNEIVTKALAEGVGFIPGCGQFVAIIILVPGQQITILRYPVPCGGGSETVWAYGENTFIELGVARKWGWIFEVKCP